MFNKYILIKKDPKDAFRRYWLCSFPSERPPKAQKNILFICVVVPIKLLVKTERESKNAGLRFVLIIQFFGLG